METTPTKLFNKNFVLLWQGQFVSQIGSQIAVVALMFWLKHQTDRASLVGLYNMILTLTITLLTPIGGTFADNHSRKKIFVISDVIAGCISLTVAGIMLFVSSSLWQIMIVVVLAQFAFGAATAFFNPAIYASIPDIVPQETLQKANSLRNSLVQLAILIGYGVGGVLFTRFGAPLVFLINGITYYFSAFSELFITIPQRAKNSDTTDWKEKLQNFITDTKGGLGFLRQEKGVRNIMVSFALNNFFLSPFLVLLPFFVEDSLHVGPGWYGYIMGGLGGGMFLGYMLVAFLKVSEVARMRIAVASLLVFAALSGSYGFVSNPVAAVLLFVLAGAILGFFNVVFETAIQLKTPSELRGRIGGIIYTVSAGLMPLGMGLSGIIADALDKNIPLIFLCSGTMVFLINSIIFSQKTSRDVLCYQL